METGGEAQDPQVSPSAPTIAPEPPPDPLFSRVIGVILSPVTTFRNVVTRPAWVGAFVIYLIAIGLSTVVYSLNVDWEALMRSQFEDSLGWKLASSLVPEEKLSEVEHGAVEEILSTGAGGMTLLTTANTITGGAIGFIVMGIIFATLFYLMGALGDLKLGRIYFDGFLCFLMFIAWAIIGAIVRGLFGSEARDALPWQAGVNTIFLFAFLYVVYKTVERQPAFKKLMSVYAHGMTISVVASLLVIVVVLIQREPLTVGPDQVLRSNIAALAGMKGSGLVATILGALDIFTLWQLVTLTIGFAAATGLSIWMTASITFLPWGFVTMVKIAAAALFGA